MTMPTMYDRVEALLKLINEKKAILKSIEKPSWETNLSFREGNESKNLHTATEEELVLILAKLRVQAQAYNEAAKTLGVKTVFKHGGFTYLQWEHDIKLRVNICQANATKKTLNDLEEKLKELRSPELIALETVDQIEAILNESTT